MIIDFHTHCFPDKIYMRAIAELSLSNKIYPSFDGSVGGLLRSMQNAGINYSVIANIATSAKQTSNVNSFAIECQKNNRLIPFGSIHPDFKEYKIEIDRLVSNGVKGLKFHSRYQSFIIDDIKMMNIYEYALSRGMVILIHIGQSQTANKENGNSLKCFKTLIDAFDTFKIVIAHMGGEGYSDDFEKYILGKHISFDTSFAFTELTPKIINRIINNHNTDYIFFGTDAPWAHQSDELIQYYNMEIPSVILKNILGENAFRLLEIKKEKLMVI